MVQVQHHLFAQSQRIFMILSNQGARQVPTPVQYERMCKLHGSDGGLTFDKMRDVPERSLGSTRARFAFSKFIRRQLFLYAIHVSDDGCRIIIY